DHVAEQAGAGLDRLAFGQAGHRLEHLSVRPGVVARQHTSSFRIHVEPSCAVAATATLPYPATEGRDFLGMPRATEARAVALARASPIRFHSATPRMQRGEHDVPPPACWRDTDAGQCPPQNLKNW